MSNGPMYFGFKSCPIMSVCVGSHIENWLFSGRCPFSLGVLPATRRKLGHRPCQAGFPPREKIVPARGWKAIPTR
jgi:hypothetical protein